MSFAITVRMIHTPFPADMVVMTPPFFTARLTLVRGRIQLSFSAVYDLELGN